MRKLKFLAGPLAILALAGCLESETDRAVVGALAGAAAAKITDNDVGTGALLGAGAGVLCDDVDVCTEPTE